MEMHTSWAKTKIQNCTSLCQTTASVNVEGNSVQITQKFRYLDCDIHSSGYSSPKSPKSWACLIHLWPMRLCLEEQTPQAHNQAEAGLDHSPHICASQFESTMFKAVFLGAFFGFLRVGEFAVVSNSRVQESVLVFGDVQFSKPGSHDQFVGLTFRQSKNNQHGFPQRIRLVTTSSKSLCPVQGFLDFIAIRPEYPGPFFCHFDSSPLTRYQFNSVLRKAVFFAGLGGQQIRGHSFRIGAASSAAALGVSHDNIRAMGRWRSNAFLSYIRPIPTCNLQSGC
ncbi:uncharacterized protein LOC117288920 [Asterias rubens]|uniref:uncharacterized protein LOC117288920 n=1 Tax=Asterias rubens TaxID=7604 RepID=UPI0014555D41|nr:uncharacterized protein LOC117288920 [Asterias rubens]